jgi:hypothetical protein
MKGITISQVPTKYWPNLAENLRNFRGVKESLEVAKMDLDLQKAFPWVFSLEGHSFWQDIYEGKDPRGNTPIKNETVEDLVKEAKSRGFKNGVNTKWGKISKCDEDGKVFKHELCSDGCFFYRNIKVRNEKGEWIKPLYPSSQEAITKEYIQEKIREFLNSL